MTLLDDLLLKACRAADLVEAVRSIDAGADVSVVDAKGMSALHWVAAGMSNPVQPIQQADLCKMLVDRGADVDAGRGTFATPLLTARLMNNVACGNALLALGADTRCLSSDSPEGMRLLLLDRLQAAVGLNHPGLILFAIENDWDQDTLPHRVFQTIEWADGEPGDLTRGVYTLRAWVAQRHARSSLMEIEKRAASLL